MRMEPGVVTGFLEQLRNTLYTERMSCPAWLWRSLAPLLKIGPAPAPATERPPLRARALKARVGMGLPFPLQGRTFV